MTNKATPTLAQVMGTLDEMAAAARAGDAERCRAALRVARHQGLDEEQITDAYQWGRRCLDLAARQRVTSRNNHNNTADLLDIVDQLD